jgi:intracellular septation protein
MPLVSGILITFFGGLTIYFNDPIFIYVKPTIINILFALALFFGKYFTREPILKKIMGKSIPLSDIGWEILNKRWMFFFLGSLYLMSLFGGHKLRNFGLTLKYGECCQ